jgi:hypothetical protein
MAELRRNASLACDTDYAGRSLRGQLTQAQRLRARKTVLVQDAGKRWTLREAGRPDREIEPFDPSALVE